MWAMPSRRHLKTTTTKKNRIDMRKIERIFVHCTASNQNWGVKELWAEFKAKG